MTTPVKYKLAKLLKEKGFDIPVRNYYLIKENGKFLHEGFEDSYWGDNRIVNWNKDVVGIKPFEGFISAPTIAEVVMWLYEKHGIWISVEQNIYENKFDYLITQRKANSWYVKSNDELVFNLPTEAYEVAIEHALKNLKYEIQTNK